MKTEDLINVGIGILMLFGLYKFIKYFNAVEDAAAGLFGNSKADKANEKAANAAKSASYFNPNFFPSVRDFLKQKIGTQKAALKMLKAMPLMKKSDSICKDIYDAKRGVRIGTFGIGGDNEEKVLYLFQNFNSKLEASYIAYRFADQYKQELFTYLDSFMKNETISNLRDIINEKPKYPESLLKEFPDLKNLKY